jgi:hypothetical protein
MDSLINYQNVLQSFGAEKEQEKSEAQQELDERREKIKEFTSPFEAPATENLVSLLKEGLTGTAKKGLAKLGLTNEKALKLKKAFDANGHKGLLQELSNQNPKLTNDLKKPIKAPQQQVSLPDPENDVNIEDLIPDDFKKVKGSIKSALQDEVKKLPDDKAQEFLDKFKPVKDLEEFNGDSELKAQYNLQKMRNTLDLVKGEEANPITIGSLTNKDFSDPIVKDALTSAVKQDINDLHPAYRQKFNELIKDRIAGPDDIADDLSRQKFNLHQASRTLDDLKTLEPESLKPVEDIASQASKLASPQFQQVSSIGRQLAGDTQDFEGGVVGQAKKSITNVFKTNLGKVEDIAKDKAGNIVKGITKDAVESAGEKALKVGGEIEGDTGGPEDPIGDVIGFLASAGTFLGGLFGAKHLHQKSEDIMRNVAYQMGA